MVDAEKLADILRTLIELHGFNPPSFFAMIGLNGSSVNGHYYHHDDHLECELTSDNVKGNGFTLPINIMFVDGNTGNAARVLLDAKQKPQYFLH
jgi:hypothetical protein